MIDMDNGIIKRADETIRMVGWEVWFLTPFGLCETIQEAKEIMDKNELQMFNLVRPIPVAIGENRKDYEPYFNS